MKKTKNYNKGTGIKITALFIILLLTLTQLAPALGASAAESNVTKNTVTHDIAIVLDNSGSMYDDTDRWSQALYAIGVFASMLDYDSGDKLGIYPMGEISIGKGGSSSAGRLEITKDNIGDISKIYCEHTSETIVKPAYEASEYLKSSEADEKWLIVMTDGEFYFDKSESETREKKDAKWLGNKMMEFAKNDIKVQYLGFGEASVLQSNESIGFYAANVSSADKLAGALVEICNKIFQRHKVENITNGSFSIDVSMNNIVAFAQGKGAEINSLNKSDGTKIDVVVDEKVTAGTEGTGSDYSAPKADVSGQVVTFAACEAGDYKLDYKGSDVEVFYEPNVVVKTWLTDAGGNEYTGAEGEEYYPGDYTVNFALIDGMTGKDVSQSSLLAPVSFEADLVNGGETKAVTSGQAITLKADDNTKIEVKASFLNQYEITNEGDPFGGAGITVNPPDEEELSVTLSTEQGGRWFKPAEHESWMPIRADITYAGSKLTDEELKNVTLTLDPEPSEELTYTCTPISGESAYEIKLGMNEKGEYVEPECKSYRLSATAKFTDEYDRELEASDHIRFDVQWYSKFWRWLLWILILVALIILIIIILNLPAWPRRMRFVVSRPREDEGLRATIKIRSVGMKIVPYEDALNCSAEKNSKIMQRLFSPKSMSIKAKNFASEEIRSFSIGAHTYTQNKDFQLPDVDNEIIVNGTEIEVVFENGTKAKGQIEIY